MRVVIDVKDEDVMSLLMAGTPDDPVLLPYGQAIADEVARRLSLDPIELSEMRSAYVVAGEAMNNLGVMVANALKDANERHEGDETSTGPDEEVDSDP